MRKRTTKMKRKMKMISRDPLRWKKALEGTEGVVTDVALYREVLDEMWKQCEKPPQEWYSDNGLVYSCSAAESLTDASHRPDGFVDVIDERLEAITGVSYSKRLQKCVCGNRDGDVTRGGANCEQKWVIDRPQWQIKLLGGRPFYLVCPKTKTVDDRRHSVPPGDKHYCMCICGVGSEFFRVVPAH